MDLFGSVPVFQARPGTQRSWAVEGRGACEDQSAAPAGEVKEAPSETEGAIAPVVCCGTRRVWGRGRSACGTRRQGVLRHQLTANR